MKNRKCPNRNHCWDYKSGNCENCDLGDHIIKLHKKIDRLKAKIKQSEWISVEDRLPDKYGDVICCTRKGTIWQLTYNPTYKLFNVSYDNVENAMDVTHWMPLPEPPKKGDAE